MTLLIKNGHVLDPATETDEEIDIFIEDGKIAKRGKKLKCKAERVIDAAGSYVMPGFIDLHVHLRDPGYEEKETIASGVRAAAKGGYTTILAMPNTKPVVDNADVVSYVHKKAESEGLTRVLQVGAVTKGQQGEELADIKANVNVDCTILTVDAMTGQDAVNVASSFNEKLGITGVILTKLDGDTRGGAALSVRSVTGKPIKFSGIGEKLTDIEPFYPDRMASRILGMGDVLTLIEKAEQAFDEKQAEELTKKIKNDKFTLEDFLEQFQQVKKLGSMEEILGMMPGVDASKLKDAKIDQKATARIEAIIRSMTPRERRNPELLNASRKKRIAAGSGTTVQEVNRLLKQFEQSRQLMKRFAGMGRKKSGRRKGFFGF